MAAPTDTVHDRINGARVELTPIQLVILLGLVTVVGATLLFIQEPLVHDSLHNFRHAIGITCH